MYLTRIILMALQHRTDDIRGEKSSTNVPKKVKDIYNATKCQQDNFKFTFSLNIDLVQASLILCGFIPGWTAG